MTVGTSELAGGALLVYFADLTQLHLGAFPVFAGVRLLEGRDVSVAMPFLEDAALYRMLPSLWSYKDSRNLVRPALISLRELWVALTASNPQQNA